MCVSLIMAVNSDSDDEMELAMLAAASTMIIANVPAETRRKPRGMWVRPMFQQRAEIGAYNLLMTQLRDDHDSTMYSGFTRITAEQFDYLLSLVKEDITGSSRFRLPIAPEMKLAVTLRYL